MDSQNKQNYLNEVKRLRVLEKLVKETQEKIDGDFINYYRAEHPADVEALEKHLNANIKRLVVLKYEDDYDNWCDVVIIKTENGGTVTFDISRSDQWETDEEAVILENIQDKKISGIISDIFEEFPYINVEHL
jgi:hypothetical protein